MKKIAFALYRDWAFEIFEEIEAETTGSFDIEISILITTPEQEFIVPPGTKYEVVVIDGKDQSSLASILKEHDINTVCFYGWSWIVKEPVLSDYTCLCLHPSPLPKYRGGSPIQHQLVAGETTSAVSIIKMSEGVDDGDIYTQILISFTGYLDDILREMIKAGKEGTRQYINDLIAGTVKFFPQENLEKFPPLKRRKPEDGQIDIVTAQSTEYTKIYNLVRGLQKPYPNAFVVLPGGTLFIEKINFVVGVPKDIVVIDKGTKIVSIFPLAMNVKDGYVLVESGRFETN